MIAELPSPRIHGYGRVSNPEDLVHRRSRHRAWLATTGAVLVAALACAVVAAAGDLLEPGVAFPAWQLPDQSGAIVRSQDLAGKTYLLWFYPKAQTPGCTLEGQQLRDRFAEFQSRGVEVLGVSFDTPADNAAFVAAEHFPFRLLSDRDRSLAIATGAASTASQPTARRISYLVGPDARVLKAYGEVVPAAHAGQVLGDLASPGSASGAAAPKPGP